MQVKRWQEIEKEQLNPLYERQVIHGEAMTVVRAYIKKGCVVAEHSHPTSKSR
jgi:quercetin dioxygenase-like cupin family protein